MKVLLLLLVSITGTLSQDYCALKPSSWIRPQTGSQSMFFITTDPKCYKSRTHVKVHLFSDITQPFTGFVIKASKADGLAIGLWEVPYPLDFENCDGRRVNVLLLKESMGLNYTYIELTWMAPITLLHPPVTFTATFTDKDGNDWMNVTSDPIKFNETCGEVATKKVSKDLCSLVPTDMLTMDNKSAMMNYGIQLSQTCYKRSDVIKVSLFANLRTPFYGFVLQARMLHGNGTTGAMARGKFIRDETNKVEVWGCHENQDNTLFLPPSSQKYTVIEMMWTPRDQMAFSHLIFNASVVDDKGVSTVNITSQPLTYDLYCGESVVPSGIPITGGAPQLMTSLVYVLMMMSGFSVLTSVCFE